MASDLQRLCDAMSEEWRKERAATQMTLGKLISALSAMAAGAPVPNLRAAHSYRGYYSDLAFEYHGGNRPAADLLADAHAAMGRVFEGYKGGEFVMHENTPVWVASWGVCGVKLMAISESGYESREDD